MKIYIVSLLIGYYFLFYVFIYYYCRFIYYIYIFFFSFKKGWVITSSGELAVTIMPLTPPSEEILSPESSQTNENTEKKFFGFKNIVSAKIIGNKLKGDLNNDQNNISLTMEALNIQEEKRKMEEMLIVRTIRGGDDNGHPLYEVNYFILYFLNHKYYYDCFLDNSINWNWCTSKSIISI